MPGLTGLMSTRKVTEDLRQTLDMMTSMTMHEKFYRNDKKVYQKFAIASTDLCRGSFMSRIVEDDSCVLGFTGQIYDRDMLAGKLRDNKRPLELQDLLMGLYKENGVETLCGLNGLYLIVIWDKKTETLHIVNDRYGFKKLYYWKNGNGLVFASEYKSISWMPDFPRKIDEFAFANLMTLGYVLDDRTLFEQIKLLPSASIATLRGNVFTIRKYWDYSFFEEGDPRLRETEYIDAFAEKISLSVRKMIMDVDRLALPLSGGLDSRTVAAVLYRLNTINHVKAYSHGNRKGCYDVKFGKAIAKTLGFPHSTGIIKGDFIRKYARSFQYLSEGTAACDWAWEIEMQKNAFSKDGMDTVISGFFGDILCGSETSWNKLMKVGDDETAVRRIYSSFFDSFSEDEARQYLNPDIYRRTKDYNYEVIRRTYFDAPTDNIFNRARYVNLVQMQRRFGSTMLDRYEFFATVLSPFTENEFVDFILHVPVEMQLRQALYVRMLNEYFPEVVKIGYARTGIPIKPSWWQAGLKWRLEKYKLFFEKISLGRIVNVDYNDYRNVAHALRTHSRQFAIDTFKNKTIKKAFFNSENFDAFLTDFLNSKSRLYEKVCYPLTFFVWADIFCADSLSNDLTVNEDICGEGKCRV